MVIAKTVGHTMVNELIKFPEYAPEYANSVLSSAYGSFERGDLKLEL